MPSLNEIIAGLQFNFFHAADAINSADAPAFTINYQFEDTDPSEDYFGFSGWTAWTQAEKDGVLAALTHIETFLNVDFVEVTGDADADLSLGRVSLGDGIAGYGGAWLSTYSTGQVAGYDAFAVFDAAMDLTDNIHLILHEVGHALGLDHPFDGVTLDPAYDNSHYTVMSYTEDPLSGADNDAMMLFDVLALQSIWGAAAYNSGDTVYTGSRTDTVDTVWDTGGIDTFDATAHAGGVTLNLAEGAFSTFGSYDDVAIAYGVTIENARGGAGRDWLLGNGADNVLTGWRGNDVVKGDDGRDTLIGGNGRDRLYGGTGTDTLKGGNGKDVLKGGGGTDKIYGGGGDDRLEGGNGTDRLWGGAGADTFHYKAGADKDMVKDFETGLDVLEIAGLGSFDEVMAAARAQSGNVCFDFGDGDLLIVRDMTLDALESDILVI